MDWTTTDRFCPVQAKQRLPVSSRSLQWNYYPYATLYAVWHC